MTVHDLIKFLSKEVKECDRKTAEIEIWDVNQEYEIECMGGFSLSPDIIIKIKPVKISRPLMKPATFKKEHIKMIAKKVNQIKNL